jgi:hypothetical protein
MSVEQLGYTDGERRTAGRGEAVRLGQILEQYMSRAVEPNYGRYGGVEETVAGLLGPELSRYAAVRDVEGGVMTVGVRSPSHLYELRLCEKELVGQLRELCVQAKIKRIKFVMES